MKPTRNEIVVLAKEIAALTETRINTKDNQDVALIQAAIENQVDNLLPQDFTTNGLTESAIATYDALGYKRPVSKRAATVAASKVKIPKYTRHNAFVDAFRQLSGHKKSEIVQLSDDLYNAKHPDSKAITGKKKGTDAGSIAELQFRFSMPTLLLLGIASEKDGLFTLELPTSDEEVVETAETA